MSAARLTDVSLGPPGILELPDACAVYGATSTTAERHKRASAHVADGPHDFTSAVLRVYQYYCLRC
jgi:hypothetical protein